MLSVLLSTVPNNRSNSCGVLKLLVICQWKDNTSCRFLRPQVRTAYCTSDHKTSTLVSDWLLQPRLDQPVLHFTTTLTSSLRGKRGGGEAKQSVLKAVRIKENLHVSLDSWQLGCVSHFVPVCNWLPVSRWVFSFFQREASRSSSCCWCWIYQSYWFPFDHHASLCSPSRVQFINSWSLEPK